MARFRLLPARVREGRLVQKAGDPLELDWPRLLEHFRPERLENHDLLKGLLRLRYGCYVGKTLGSRTGSVVPFVLVPPEGAIDLGWLDKLSPGAAAKFQEIWLVDAVERDASVQE